MAVTLKNVSEEVGQKLNPLATKAPVSSVGAEVLTLDPPVAHDPFTSKKIVLLGVKPVPEIVPAAWSKEMSGTGTSCPPLAAYLVHCPSFLNGVLWASV